MTMFKEKYWYILSCHFHCYLCLHQPAFCHCILCWYLFPAWVSCEIQKDHGSTIVVSSNVLCFVHIALIQWKKLNTGFGRPVKSVCFKYFLTQSRFFEVIYSFIRISTAVLSKMASLCLALRCFSCFHKSFNEPVCPW